MGICNIFNLKTKCPYCGETKIRELQTNKTDCVLHSWKENDKADFNGVMIKEGLIKDVYGGCTSESCKKRQITENGEETLFGRIFQCDILITKRKIKKATNIRKLSNNNDKGIRTYVQKRRKRCAHQHIRKRI